MRVICDRFGSGRVMAELVRHPDISQMLWLRILIRRLHLECGGFNCLSSIRQALVLLQLTPSFLRMRQSKQLSQQDGTP